MSKNGPRVVPRVVIDARMVGPIPHGFARYVTRLAEGFLLLQEKKELGYELVFLVSSQLKDLQKHPFGAFETVEVGAKFLSPMELLELPIVLKRLGASLYHSPSFSSLYRSPCPWVVTVHDLNHLTYGGKGKKFYYEYLLKPFARGAQKLITVSEFSRQELAKWTGLPAESIEIVYNSMDPDYLVPWTPQELSPVLARYGLMEGNYLICLSNPKPHKNISTLICAYEAYSQALSAGEALPLVLSMKEYAQIPGVKAVGSLPDSDVSALLVGSRAVLFPSLYEGFGLPPVEAASLGGAVIASRIPPHLEGLAELKPEEVTWVEPRDVAGWADALHAASLGKLNRVSAESRSRLIARFDPKRMAQDMDRIYRPMLALNS